MTQHNAPGELDVEKVNELARCFWYSAMLRAGIKLGAFDLLDTGEFSSDDVAHRISASSRYVRVFLDGCVVLDLLVERGGGHVYQFAPRVQVPG